MKMMRLREVFGREKDERGTKEVDGGNSRRKKIRRGSVF
jgi:hypothetical protein